jgi:hypothetical protein
VFIDEEHGEISVENFQGNFRDRRGKMIIEKRARLLASHASSPFDPYAFTRADTVLNYPASKYFIRA